MKQSSRLTNEEFKSKLVDKRIIVLAFLLNLEVDTLRVRDIELFSLLRFIHLYFFTVKFSISQSLPSKAHSESEKSYFLLLLIGHTFLFPLLTLGLFCSYGCNVLIMTGQDMSYSSIEIYMNIFSSFLFSWREQRERFITFNDFLSKITEFSFFKFSFSFLCNSFLLLVILS